MRFRITPESGPARTVEDAPKDIADWEEATGHNALKLNVRDWGIREFWVLAWIADTRRDPERPPFDTWKQLVADVTLDADEEPPDPTQPAP